MTVQELIQSKYANKIWLCPNIVSESRFTISPLLQGIDCTRGTVPSELLDKPVKKSWHEGGSLCIIWENEPYVPNKEVQS